MTTSSGTLGLYLHIPFCRQKCGYCGFLSSPCDDSALLAAYTEALLSDIRNAGDPAVPVDTVYFGGGTPTVLPAAEFATLLDTIRTVFYVLQDAEITVEANPGTVDRRYLEELRDAGVDRLSLGVQALDDGLLRALGRIHTAEEAMQAVRDARAAGFDNLSLDLMFSIPGQTEALWEATLEKALDLGPDHLSIYSLQLEEGTPFFQLYRNGRLQLADDRTDRRMYHRALDLMEAEGLRPYEIANAARPGRECRHNLKYWSMDDYLGLGLGAHSFRKGWRFRRTEVMEEYLAVQKDVDRKKNTRSDSIGEFIFTGLRKMEGIQFEDFTARFGCDVEELFPEAIHRHKNDGLLVADRTVGRLYLTQKGIDISNSVLADFV